MTLSTLVTFNLRYYRRHSMLSLLCLMGISLGVGIVVAVQLINNSALSAFASSVDYLSGRATHSVISDYGRIEEEHFVRIWKHPGIKAASPVIQVMANTLEIAGEPVQFIGIDPFLDADFRDLGPMRRGERDLTEFLTSDVPVVYLSESLMERYGLGKGDILTVLSAGVEKKTRIAGSIPASGLSGGDTIAVLDISAAQEIFGKEGYLDRIDLIAESNTDRLLDIMPLGLHLTDSNERKSTLQGMLYSFQLNLAAMSLLALFVGTFLIYNFSMFSVLSRREDLSLLLTLGADRAGLVGAFLTESVLLGAAGSLLGIALGFLVAWFSIDRVSSTISELYFHISVESVGLTVPVVLRGIGVGFLATIVGTGLPALEVAVTPPVIGIKRQSIEDRAHGLKGLLTLAGVSLFGLALVAAWASRFSIFWGFASAFAVTFAFALFTPSILSQFTHHAGSWFKRFLGSLEAFLAARTIRASLSRTSIATAALAVALSMTIGVDTMIHGFRQSVDAWLEGSLQGDLYISPATTKWAHPLPDELIEMLRQDPRVEAVERYSTYGVRLKGKPARLRVVDGSVLKHRSRFTFLQGERSAWDKMEQGGVFISESLGYHFDLGVGDAIELATPLGKRSFPIVAMVRDYSSEQGTIQMDRQIYEEIWKDRKVQSVALFLKPGVSPDEVRRSVAQRVPGLDRTISSNTQMRSDILVIFDKTFAPTATLKGVSLLVALLGIATALTAILMERSREMTVLSYLGLTPAELGKMNVYQALVMGLVSFMISVVCGLILTYIITNAINYRSFGWSIDIHVNPWVFVKAFLLTGLACLAASIYPTYKLMRAAGVHSLEEE
ncbi:MAG: FtsX-like permease family protein [Desulfomonilaceae bacterium]|nr:FtsX-like permease family protein [Desulfomonilaceae bacterium]